MAAVTVVTYLWGEKYTLADVNKLFKGVARNITLSWQFAVISDQAKVGRHRTVSIPEPDRHLTRMQGCFARLRLFDPVFAEQVTDGEDGDILVLDLDTVITGSLDAIAARDEPFVILQNINSTNPCLYNGSVWKLRPGYRPDVWSAFSLEAAAKAPYHAFPDDQGWFHHMMPDAAAYGPDCGVYGFKKKGWPSGDDLPSNAAIVAFPGWRSPDKFDHIDWIMEHWRK